MGIDGNIKWLIDVSKELAPGLKAIVNNHLESDVPIIIEGDFIHPELIDSLKNPKVKSLYIIERDTNQILQNYQAREGGTLQNFRAEVSKMYGEWLEDSCENLGIRVIESRPWNTAIERCVENLEGIRIKTHRLLLEPLGMKYLQSTHAYASEAAKAVIEFAIEQLGVTHLIAHCDSENVGSFKIMEKLGMKLTDRSFGRKNKSSEEKREELKYERILGE